MRFSSRIPLGNRASRSLLNVFNSDRVKRIIDIGGALFALAILWPIMLICAVAIRLGGVSSVIFCQERIGRFGKPFRMFKLTTMKTNWRLIIADM